MDRAFPVNSASVVFADLYTQPVAGMDVAAGTVFDLDAARLVFVLNTGSGQFWALDGDGNGHGTWRTLSPTIALDGNGMAAAWQHLTVRLDYAGKTYDVYINGQMIAYDLHFRLNSASYFSWFSMKGHTSANAWLDKLRIESSNPLFIDANNDGMPDNLDRYGDADGDGLTNIREIALGTNPTNADSDGDGISDGWEVAHGLNPLHNDASSDSDHDGLSNLQEYHTGRDPHNATDGGLMSSGVVIKVLTPAGQNYSISTPSWVITPE